MADGAFEAIFLVSTNFRLAEQGVGGGRKEVAQPTIQHCLEQEKPPKAATEHPFHTTRPRRRLTSNRNSSRSWPAQLVLSTGAILLTVTSQGWQNALQKSRPVHIGQ